MKMLEIIDIETRARYGVTVVSAVHKRSFNFHDT